VSTPISALDVLKVAFAVRTIYSYIPLVQLGAVVSHVGHPFFIFVKPLVDPQYCINNPTASICPQGGKA
jgi:hypothetical protein